MPVSVVLALNRCRIGSQPNQVTARRTAPKIMNGYIFPELVDFLVNNTRKKNNARFAAIIPPRDRPMKIDARIMVTLNPRKN